MSTFEMTWPRKPWHRLPLRTCRTFHHCDVCSNAIRNGEQYRDGGFNRRAHVACGVAQDERDGRAES